MVVGLVSAAYTPSAAEPENPCPPGWRDTSVGSIEICAKWPHTHASVSAALVHSGDPASHSHTAQDAWQTWRLLNPNAASPDNDPGPDNSRTAVGERRTQAMQDGADSDTVERECWFQNSTGHWLQDYALGCYHLMPRCPGETIGTRCVRRHTVTHDHDDWFGTGWDSPTDTTGSRARYTDHVNAAAPDGHGGNDTTRLEPGGTDPAYTVEHSHHFDTPVRTFGDDDHEACETNGLGYRDVPADRGHGGVEYGCHTHTVLSTHRHSGTDDYYEHDHSVLWPAVPGDGNTGVNHPDRKAHRNDTNVGWPHNGHNPGRSHWHFTANTSTDEDHLIAAHGYRRHDHGPAAVDDPNTPADETCVGHCHDATAGTPHIHPQTDGRGNTINVPVATRGGMAAFHGHGTPSGGFHWHAPLSTGH